MDFRKLRTSLHPWCLVVLCCVWPGVLQANTLPLKECSSLEQVPDGVLSVAIRPAPPYILENGVRGLEGISVDLWERVAQELQIDYQYVCLGLQETLEALQTSSIDLAISPLTISRQREQLFDFSHQYFSSSLVLATRPEAISFDFSRVLQTMVQIITSAGFITLMLLFFLLTVSISLISYRNMDRYTTLAQEDMGGKIHFRLHLLLMAALNTLGMRKDIFSFNSIRVQFFFLLVLMGGSLFSSSLGGMITAAFMSSTTTEQIVSVDVLRQGVVSTMKGSTAERYLTAKLEGWGNDISEEDPQWLRRDSWLAVLDDLASGRADVALGDWVQMTWLANQPEFKGRVQISPTTLRLEPHGWGLPPGSGLREPVDQELIGVLRNTHWPDVVRGYLGGNKVSAK